LWRWEGAESTFFEKIEANGMLDMLFEEMKALDQQLPQSS